MYQNSEPSAELLVCFDEQGNSIEPHMRQEVHQKPPAYWHAVVNIWLVNKKGEILCSLRAKTLSGNPDKWQTYFGGHVKAGATYKETAVAELEEEVGLKIDPNKLFFITSGTWEPSKHFSESYAYPFDEPLEALHFNDGEIVEVGWFSFKEYNQDKQENPERWCNGCSPENQKRIMKWLKES